VIHYASISGGADSLATALVAIERAERRGMDLRLINADLGVNENPITRDYIGYLEQALGLPILRVRADFTAEFAARRESIQHHWSREKRRKEHTAECKARRDTIPPVVSNCRPSVERRDALKAWIEACDCPERVSPPVAQEIIDRAKALLIPTGEPFLDRPMQQGKRRTLYWRFDPAEYGREIRRHLATPFASQSHPGAPSVGGVTGSLDQPPVFQHGNPSQRRGRRHACAMAHSRDGEPCATSFVAQQIEQDIPRRLAEQIGREKRISCAATFVTLFCQSRQVQILAPEPGHRG